jgi:DNA-binding transcriptional ArsR family regulator
VREPDELPGIRFRLATDAVDRVRFVYSAAYEAALSLHVLAEPKRHAAQHAWVRRARRLTPGLRRRLQDFRFAWLFGPPDFMLPQAVAPDFDAELERLRSLPAELVAFEFLRAFWDHSGERDPALLRNRTVREHVSRRVGAYGGDRDLALLLFDDPAELRARFLALLSDYRDELFGAEWAKLERELAGAVVEAQEQLATDGLYPLLETFGRRLVVDRDRSEFGIDLPHFHRVPVTDETPLHLVPSAFVWPGVRVNCDAPFPPTIVYPAPFVARRARPAAPDAELLRLGRALADDTRLRALRLIAQAPRSTQELAALISISDAGLSKHLRALSEAGLVETRREGYYVLYSLAEGALDRLPPELRAFLQP